MDIRENDKWLEFAIRIQSIAQAGLQYGRDKYDRERYEELRRIAAEMAAEKTDVSADKIYGLFCNESGSTLRFLIPLCLLFGQKITLKGTQRLMSRSLAVYKEMCLSQGIEFKED